jgi:hypothetical protein
VVVEFGNVDTPPKTEWWAKVRTPAGVVGWVRAEKTFDGADGCA